MLFAGENLRDWLANLSHNVTDESKKPIGLVSTLQEEDIPETGGSIDYVPDGPGTRPETDLYNEYLDKKIKELGELEEDRWEPEEDEDPDPADPADPADPEDPVDEIDPERKAAQDELIKRWGAQIAEDGGTDYARIIADGLRSSRVATPEDFDHFHWAFQDDDHGLGGWKKIGGGNKMGSGGAAVSAARKAGERSGPGLGFAVGQAVRGVKARFSDTQGKGIKTGADGFGYSNHSRKNSYNTHGVGQ